MLKSIKSEPIFCLRESLALATGNVSTDAGEKKMSGKSLEGDEFSQRSHRVPRLPPCNVGSPVPILAEELQTKQGPLVKDVGRRVSWHADTKVDR